MEFFGNKKETTPPDTAKAAGTSTAADAGKKDPDGTSPGTEKVDGAKTDPTPPENVKTDTAKAAGTSTAADAGKMIASEGETYCCIKRCVFRKRLVAVGEKISASEGEAIPPHFEKL